jgi:hypothetical protein
MDNKQTAIPLNEVASRIKNIVAYPSEMFHRIDVNRLIFLAAYHKELNALYAHDPRLGIYCDTYRIELVCNSRESTVATLQLFATPGVNWDRDSDDSARITYSKPIDLSFLGLPSEMRLTIAGTPPPSCKVVEKEIDVPACKRIVKKVVCANGDDVPTN